MNAHTSKAALARCIADARATLEGLTVAEGFSLMLHFYRDTRAEDCSANDGDMLLYQWGTYDWGDGKFFEMDFTRQFMLSADEDDQSIWQLSLTFKFAQSDSLKALSSGNRWCYEPTPSAITQFGEFLRGSPAYAAVDGIPLVKVELDYFNAG